MFKNYIKFDNGFTTETINYLIICHVSYINYASVYLLNYYNFKKLNNPLTHVLTDSSNILYIKFDLRAIIQHLNNFKTT